MKQELTGGRDIEICEKLGPIIRSNAAAYHNLYRIEEGMPVFVILTREPGEEIRFIHDRMPLIMPERHISDWIQPDAKPEELLSQALTEMVFEKAV